MAVTMCGCPTEPPRRISGFSQLELLVVLTVLGILLAFVAPSMVNLQATGLSAAGREFGNFLGLCRNEAIAGRTSIRVGIVVDSSNPVEAHGQYAAWKWDKLSRSYLRHSSWRFLPQNVLFEPSLPGYLDGAEYATEEPWTLIGDFVLTATGNVFEMSPDSPERRNIQFFTFSPSGRASIPGGEQRSLILVLRPRDASSAKAENWMQFSVDTLTGRTRVYRP